MKRGSNYTELLMCGEGVRSILLLPLVARCLETIDVCIRRIFVLMYVVVIVWGVCWNVCCVAAVVKECLFSLGVLKYVSVRGVMDVVFSVCIVTRGAVGARGWEV